MKKIHSQKNLILGITVLLLALFISIPVYAKSEKSGRVLFISSYSYAWETVPQQIEGIQESLNDCATIDYQFMDTKNVNTPEAEQLFYEQIRYFLQHQEPYDVIIVGDDAAFDFAMKYEDELFTNIPIVFEGVENTQKVSEAAKTTPISGVIEPPPFSDTIKLAQDLYPNATQVVAILDDTLTGIGEQNQYYALQDDFPDLKFQEINASKLTKTELLHKVSSLDRNSILIYVICSENVNGESYAHSDIISNICDIATIPVFSVVPHSMGKGFLGGTITSHKEMGVIAGEMAKEILDGTAPSEIKIQNGSPSKLCFDENIMKRFHIKKSQLPDNTEIINHKQSFLERAATRLIILIIILVIGSLLFIIYKLWADVKKKNQTNLSMSEANEQLRLDSHYDALTSIYNRRALMEDLENLITQNRSFGLIMFDLDNFKHINDYYGHTEGDSVLKEIAARSKKLSDPSSVSYRFGGDEFFIIIDSGSTRVIEKYANKFRTIFDEPFKLGSESQQLHCSMGVAMYPQDARDVSSILNAADEAMYYVKKNSKNGMAFYHDVAERKRN